MGGGQLITANVLHACMGKFPPAKDFKGYWLRAHNKTDQKSGT